jgi:hypothetical protein
MNNKMRKKVSNMQVKRKCPKGRLRSKYREQVRKIVTKKEGKTCEENEEEEVWEERQMERLGCWMTYTEVEMSKEE